MSRGEDIQAQIKTIEDEEHKTDEIIRAVLQDVRRIFLTPFDRGGITALIGVMDDSVDQMYKTAGAVDLYDVDPVRRARSGRRHPRARISIL